MANDSIDENAIPLGDEELIEGLEKKKVNGKLIVLAVGGLVVLVGMGFGVMSFLGGDGAPPVKSEIEQLAEGEAAKNKEAEARAAQALEKLETTFIDIEGLTVNLNTDNSGRSFLNIAIKLEVDRPSYKEAVEARLPRVMSELNIYIRELRPSDLEGGAGILRLKEELLTRINQAVAPAVVSDVLFQRFIIQGG